MIINVTAEDLDFTRKDETGKQWNCITDCAVARAVTRATGRKAFCGFITLDIEREDGLYDYYDFPKEIAQKIESFCARERVEPFSFDLSACRRHR